MTLPSNDMIFPPVPLVGVLLRYAIRADVAVRVCAAGLGRLRKKGIPQPAPSISSLPVGREVKESSHPFGFAQDKLLCRVRNGRIRPGLQESFFPHPAGKRTPRPGRCSYLG